MRRDYKKELHDLMICMVNDITNFIGRGNDLEFKGMSYEKYFKCAFKRGIAYKFEKIHCDEDGRCFLIGHYAGNGQDASLPLVALDTDKILQIHEWLNL